VKVSHILVDLWPAEREMLTHVEPVQSILLVAIKASEARILHQRFHQFEPYGFTGLVLIAESHMSVHSWVEEGTRGCPGRGHVPAARSPCLSSGPGPTVRSRRALSYRPC